MSEPERIRDESDLEALDVPALKRRFGPLLRRARLAPSKETRERHEDNLPFAVVELACSWASSPMIDGRVVDLEEFLWVRLPYRLRELDAEQEPDMYDAHRRYFSSDRFEGPRTPPVSLDAKIARGDDGDGMTLHDVLGHEDEVDGLPTPEGRPAPIGDLVERMEAAGIHSVPSQLAAMRMLAAVDANPELTPRQVAKALGHADYKTRPATQIALAALELLGAYEDAGVQPTQPEFQVRLDDPL
jgi:hypothetical protein